MIYLKLCVITFCLILNSLAYKDYNGYKLLEAKVESRQQANIISEVEDTYQLDIWSTGPEVWDILVSPTFLTTFNNYLTLNKIKHYVKNVDIQRDIDLERERLAQSATSGESRAINYDDFNTYEDIMTELDSLAARCPAALTCETFVTGQSVENRDIKGLRIYRTDRVQTSIWLDATIHAREWLSTATHLKIMSHLVDDYGVDLEVQDLVDRHAWYLQPIINTDGYAFTWEEDRLWRKSRNINEGSPCNGTDLNRNFDHNWGSVGASELPCGETYRGPGAGSEPETQALSQALVSLGPNLITTIHLHTYSQFWLIPWSGQEADGNCTFAADDSEMMVVANAAADATQNTYGTTWARGNWCTVLYASSGVAADYAKQTAGVKYTFTPELRGNSFVVPPTEIQPSFDEVWNGVTAAIAAIEAA